LRPVFIDLMEVGFLRWITQLLFSDEYKNCFQFTVDYLKNLQNDYNLFIFIFSDNTFLTSSSYLSRYPGSGYVDVFGYG
jgi:mannan endo-1,4-beta-mannosidase